MHPAFSRQVAPLALVAGVAMIAVSAALAVPPPTSAAKTAAGGGPAFTSAQAGQGQQVYVGQCQSCHGANLQGVAGPALMGNGFLAKWANGQHPLGDLYSVISKQMPLTAPGSLSQKQYLDVTAYILSRNGYQASNKALTKAVLGAKLNKPATA